MNLTKIFNKGNVKGDISPTEFIHRGNVKDNLADGQYVLGERPNIIVRDLADFSNGVGDRALTPFQAAILNNFLKHSGYSGYYDAAETLNRFGIREVVSNAIKEGSDFTPYLRDALKNDPAALAAFEESLKQAASFDDAFKTMNASKTKLAEAKAREEQAAALYEIKKQTEQANRNAKFIKKYGVPYNRFNASKEYIKDALWRGDKSIYNSIKNIKNMDKPTKLVAWNGLNALSPFLWNSQILEEFLGNKSLKDWGQAGQMAATGYLGNKLFGASKKAAAIAAMMQGLVSLGASTYSSQNQDKPNNIESQEKPIEKYKGW